MDSDPDYKAKLYAAVDYMIRFGSSTSTRDPLVPVIFHESNKDGSDLSDPDHLKKLEEDVDAKLMRFCSTFSRTRDVRRDEAGKLLRWAAKPRANDPVAKACTWSSGDQLLSETWLGITWVALQRKDESLCVVVRNTDLLNLERELVHYQRGEAIEDFTKRFWNAIVSNVEDTKEQLFGLSCVQPFAVVAVAAASKDPEALTEAMNLAEKTSKFFLEKLKSGASLTSEETVETAILATQYLFEQEFEADELRVFLWDKEEFIAEELVLKPEDLDLDFDLEELLACMNGPDNDDSSMHSSERRRLGAAA